MRATRVMIGVCVLFFAAVGFSGEISEGLDVATLAGSTASEIVVSDPGFYYLSGNLEVTKTNGIQIQASGVTLDLNGFRISRISGGGGDGVRIDGGMDDVAVRNGRVTGFQYGVRCDASRFLLEKLEVTDCTGAGIRADSSSQIIDCLAYGNAGDGILAGSFSTVSRCVARDNRGNGIYVLSNGTVSECAAYDNGGDCGIFAGSGSALSGCAAYDNEGEYGIFAGSGSVLSGCVAHHNKGKSGIVAGSGSTLSGCAAHHNEGEYGLFAGAGSMLSGCVAHHNKGKRGLFAGAGSALNGCEAHDNQGEYGISAGSGSALSGCVVQGEPYPSEPVRREPSGL